MVLNQNTLLSMFTNFKNHLQTNSDRYQLLIISVTLTTLALNMFDLNKLLDALTNISRDPNFIDPFYTFGA